MANAVKKGTIFTASRDNVVELLDNRTNVNDPVSSSSEHRKFVYSREPDVTASDFQGYPFIIVHPVSTSFPEEGRSLDRTKSFADFAFEIEVVTSDRGYNSEDGKGLEHIDAISNDIVETLNDVTNRDTLRKNNLYFSSPNATSVVTEELEGTLIYRRSFLLDLRNRMRVSA